MPTILQTGFTNIFVIDSKRCRIISELSLPFSVGNACSKKHIKHNTFYYLNATSNMTFRAKARRRALYRLESEIPMVLCLVLLIRS